jgi:hypothetical protein
MTSGSSRPLGDSGREGRLERCVRDMVALAALPLACVGRTLDDAVDLVLAALPRALDCDLVLIELPSPQQRRHAIWCGARVGAESLGEIDAAVAKSGASKVLVYASNPLHWLEAALPVGKGARSAPRRTSRAVRGRHRPRARANRGEPRGHCIRERERPGGGATQGRLHLDAPRRGHGLRDLLLETVKMWARR